MVISERQPRYAVEWRARLRCREWREAYRVATANVSRGGAFFAVGRTPAVGARVEVTLELPDGTAVSLTGVCVHVRPPEQAKAQGRAPGFGLRFDQSPEGDLARLEALAQAAGVPVEVPHEHLSDDSSQPSPVAATARLPDAPAVRLPAAPAAQLPAAPAVRLTPLTPARGGKR